MYKSRSLRNTRNFQLYAVAGFVAAMVTFSNLNLSEVLRWDRFQHVSLSMLLFFAFVVFYQGRKGQWVLAFLSTLTIGAFKEFLDHQAQGFDMAANLFGIGLAVLLLYAGKNLLEKKL